MEVTLSRSLYSWLLLSSPLWACMADHHCVLEWVDVRLYCKVLLVATGYKNAIFMQSIYHRSFLMPQLYFQERLLHYY